MFFRILAVIGVNRWFSGKDQVSKEKCTDVVYASNLPHIAP